MSWTFLIFKDHENFLDFHIFDEDFNFNYFYVKYPPNYSDNDEEIQFLGNCLQLRMYEDPFLLVEKYLIKCF